MTQPPTMLTIGEVRLSRYQPRIVAGFKDGTKDSAIDSAITAGVDIAEIRADLFANCNSQTIATEANKFREKKMATILTIRSKAEGGQWVGDQATHDALVTNSAPLVDAVDLELNTLNPPTLERLHELNKTAILSYHDFEQTPTLQSMGDLITAAKAKGGDIVKIATMVHCASDLAKLVNLTVEFSDSNLIVVGMGKLGLISRVMLPSFGSLISFAYVDGLQTAPGQIHATELRALLQRFNQVED